MGLGDRIKRRREQLGAVSPRAGASAQTPAAGGGDAAAIAALAESFKTWADQSGTPTESIRRKVGRKKYKYFDGWVLWTLPDGLYDSEKAYQPRRKLVLFANGTAEWQRAHVIFDSGEPATLVQVQSGIVQFISMSKSGVPWPDDK